MPSASATPGRRVCTRISASASSPCSAATPSAVFRSSVTLRLPRLNSWKFSASPCRKAGPICRASSPPSGFSTLTTLAPRSARMAPAKGPASTWPSSTTLMPARTLISCLPRRPAPPIGPSCRRQNGAAAFAEADGDIAVALGLGAEHHGVAILEEAPLLAIRQRDRLAAALGDLQQRAEAVLGGGGDGAAAEEVARHQVAAAAGVVRQHLREGPVEVAGVGQREAERPALPGDQRDLHRQVERALRLVFLVPQVVQ